MNVNFNPQVNSVFTVKGGPQVRVTKTMLDNVFYQDTARANEKGCMSRVQFETWVTFGSIPDNDVTVVVDPKSPHKELNPADRGLMRDIEALRSTQADLIEQIAELESINATLQRPVVRPRALVGQKIVRKTPKKTAKKKARRVPKKKAKKKKRR